MNVKTDTSLPFPTFCLLLQSLVIHEVMCSLGFELSMFADCLCFLSSIRLHNCQYIAYT
jgi:hypothetical protein